MFLQLNHKNLEAYKAAREFLKECYRITALLPSEERYNLTQQIRRASLSVKLNLAEGSSRKSLVERKRFYGVSRGSLIEIDTAFEAAFDLKYFSDTELIEIDRQINRTFALITGLIK